MKNQINVPFRMLSMTALVVIISFFFSGCKTIDKLTHFNMDYDESMEIPSTLGINLPFNIITPAIPSNSETTFEMNDTRKDLVESIKLRTLQLTLTAPSSGDLGFLRSIEIYLSAGDLPEVLIALNDAVPGDTGTSLELDCLDEELQAYLVYDEFNLRVKTVTDELLLSDHTINVHAVFFVDARILGV